MPSPSLSFQRSATSTCPTYRFEQESWLEGRRCGIIFLKITPPVRTVETEQAPLPEEPAQPDAFELFSRLYRILSVPFMAFAVGVVMLTLRQAPPLQIHTDPQTASRVAEKIAQLQTAVRAGQSHSLAFNQLSIGWCGRCLSRRRPGTYSGSRLRSNQCISRTMR